MAQTPLSKNSATFLKTIFFGTLCIYKNHLWSDLFIIDILHEIGIHQTLPRSPCFSINFNSFLVATLAIIKDLLSGNITLKALLSLLSNNKKYKYVNYSFATVFTKLQENAPLLFILFWLPDAENVGQHAVS